MNAPIHDLAGREVGRLTVVSLVDGSSPGRWKCRCQCGAEVIVQRRSLLSKSRPTLSCGCLRLERSTFHGHNRKGSPSLTYKSWSSMITRCKNPATINYQDYGGRGISVTDRWTEFTNFLADMGERPSGSHSLDRINVDGNYEPGNCRWATARQQQGNIRTNRAVILAGETMCLSEASRRLGVSRATLLWDLRHRHARPAIYPLLQEEVS